MLQPACQSILGENQFNSVQSLSCVRLFATPWIAARQASLSFTNSWILLKLMSSSRWCHPTISSSVILFSSYLQSFPVIGSFLISKFFTSVGQIIGVSASASILPMNINDWFPLAWIVGSLCSPRDSQESCPKPLQMMTAPMKLKDAWLFEEKLWQV